MKKHLIGTESVPMERVHSVQKLYSFLYIPWAQPISSCLIFPFLRVQAWAGRNSTGNAAGVTGLSGGVA